MVSLGDFETFLGAILVMAVLCSMTEVVALNQTCTDDCNCTEVNSVCDGTGKFLGEICTKGSTGECSDPNAGCLTNGSAYVCTCQNGSYDDTGFNHGGNCHNMNNLMVSGISFSNITTDNFTVSWIGPAGYLSHVSRYGVSWTPGSSDEIDAGTAVSATITGLSSPGAVYNVTVTTYNDVTEFGVERRVSATKQQASKPSTPGPLAYNKSNLDAVDKTINLQWTASIGDVSKYSLSVLDGSYTKYSIDNIASASIDISFSDMRNGHKYTVEITAFSHLYDGTKSVPSDAYTEEIKTIVQVPTVPTGVHCKNRSYTEISLEWKDPDYPNGNLKQYKIEVYIYDLIPYMYKYELKYNDTAQVHNRTELTTTPVDEFYVRGLEPGTYYEFRIYTENELLLSEKYAKIACKTLDRVSDPPKKVTVRKIESRYLRIWWGKPRNSYGEILGYVVQFYDDSNVCVKELIIICTSCKGALDPSHVTSSCSNTGTSKSSKYMVSASSLDIPFFHLQPYNNYTITVVAVNEAGKGHAATVTTTTLEEAPAKPKDVSISGVTATSFTVTWIKGSVRPGRTNYTVTVEAEDPAQSPGPRTLMGYDQESYTVTGLEEYWSYNITVTAETPVGSNISDVVTQRTLSAAPGPLSVFDIALQFDGSFNLIQLQWKLPHLLERNGIIQEFFLKDNSSLQNTANSKKIGVSSDSEHLYTEIRTVVPDQYYTYRICAVNTKKEFGAWTTKTIKSPGRC